jgi:hypothetical protein
MTQVDSESSTAAPAEAQGALYFPTDTTPEELFQAIGRLRKEARDEINRLIQFLDKTDDYVSRELEEAVDDVGCDDQELEPSLATTKREDAFGTPEPGPICEDEPSLGSVDVINQDRWSIGNTDDREGDPGCDDREDVCEDEGAEHDGAEPDEADSEPSLGWTAQVSQGQGTWGSNEDCERAGSTLTAAAQARYRPFDRHAVTNRDGRHVDAEPGFAGRKRLRNLSDKQREIVAPLVDSEKVSLI